MDSSAAMDQGAPVAGQGAEHQQHQHQHQANQDQKQVQKGSGFKLSLDNPYILIALAAGILIIAVYMRLGLLQYQGMFEPDGFFYYTAIKQAVAQGHFNGTVLLSGYPYHNNINEAPGIIYFAIVPYDIVKYFGVSLYDTTRLVPILFGLLVSVGAFFLVKYLAKSNALGLIAMFFVATSSGNIARTAGAVYRGDTFISFFILLALILLVMGLSWKKDKRVRYGLIIAAALVTSIGNIVWNGGFVIGVIYYVAMLILAVYGFLAKDREILDDSIVMALGFALCYVLNLGYVAWGWANTAFIYTPNTVSSTPLFPILFIPAFLGILIADYMVRTDLVKGLLARIVILLIAASALLAGAYIIAPGYISQLSGAGSVYATSNIGYTTQELQKPTWDFLWASFGLQLFLFPLGVLAFLFLAHTAGNEKHYKIKWFKVNISYAFLVAFAYLLVASYLQAGAIRYNSIVAIPIAIFAAFAIYGIGRALYGYAIMLGGTQIRLSHIFAAFALVILIYQADLAAIQSYSSAQADGINTYFLQAMTWISNNTATNARFLDLWPDGSVIEGWGNRTAFMDSVGGENSTRITAFAQWLFNTTPDSSYLVNQAYSPNYILVRQFWMAELGGIAQEGNITQNVTDYGYDPLSSAGIQGNASQQVYQFEDPNYRVEMVVTHPVNSTGSQINAYLGLVSSSQLSPMRQVLFLNQSSGASTFTNSTFNTTVNYTLMIAFTGRNITGAALLGPKLAQTNLFKLLFLCGYGACSYGNSNVTAKLVYNNPDSKIIEFNYT